MGGLGEMFVANNPMFLRRNGGTLCRDPLRGLRFCLALFTISLAQ